MNLVHFSIVDRVKLIAKQTCFFVFLNKNMYRITALMINVVYFLVLWHCPLFGLSSMAKETKNDKKQKFPLSRVVKV